MMHQRTMLDLKDIIGIEYTCAHCQSKYLVPIDKFDRIIHQCPNCKETLVQSGRADNASINDEASLSNFIDNLRDLRDRGMGIKLEISSSDPA